MFKHKFLSLFVALCCATGIFAYDAFIDGIYYNLDSTTYTAMVTNQNSSYSPAESYIGMVNIPSFITHNSQTYQVTTIGMFAFCGCSKLTSVTIPSSITTIEKSAFSDCDGLDSVVIPNSVTTIGDYAFQVCDSLTSVIIGDSVMTIGLGAFNDCKKLSSIEIPNSVNWIGSYAFQNCNSLTSVTIGNSITTIESYTFDGCSGLTTITIPNAVTTIGSHALEGCNGLTSVMLPNSVTTIGDYAFAFCSSLNSITIPNSVTTIWNNAFSGCRSLVSVTINSNVVCSKKYSYNANIKNIFGDQVKEYIIGDSVNTIGEYAFYDCKNMESVTIGKSVTSIESFAFSINNGNLRRTNYAGTIASWCKIKFNGITATPTSESGTLFINNVEIKDLVIPEGVDMVGNYAFCGCFGLSSITIPSSVTTIGDSAFWCCYSLKSITCYATTPPICGNSCYFIVPKSIPVYVPAQLVDAYKQADGWKEYFNILPIGAEFVPSINEVSTQSTENSVIIAWPQTANADTYTLEIKKNGELVCTLTFNNQGIMTNITFAAPARGGERTSSNAEMTTNGYCFTITGLEACTTYTYVVTVKNASQQTLQTYSGEFTTTGGISTDLDQFTNSPVDRFTKIIKDNRLLIFRNGKTFNALGGVMR